MKMQVNKSEFIKKNKPLFKELVDKLLEKYEYASVLACDARGKNYGISRAGIDVMESFLTTQQGFVVKVYDNGTTDQSKRLCV